VQMSPKGGRNYPRRKFKKTGTQRPSSIRAVPSIPYSKAGLVVLVPNVFGPGGGKMRSQRGQYS